MSDKDKKEPEISKAEFEEKLARLLKAPRHETPAKRPKRGSKSVISSESVED